MKIFLDLDGTILDIKHRCYKIYVSILSQFGFDVVNISTYWEMKRNRISEESIASKTTPLLFAKYYAEERVNLIETMDYLVLDSVLDGVYEILNRWFFNHTLYLVTLRRNNVNLNNQLSLLGLNRYFKHVYSADKLEVKKEDLIRHAVSNKNECIIIGDTEADIKAGKVLSIKTVAVDNGIRNRYWLEKTFPDILLSSVCDFNLVDYIENI